MEKLAKLYPEFNENFENYHNIMENRFRKQTKLSENYKNLNENNVRIVIQLNPYFGNPGFGKIRF